LSIEITKISIPPLNDGIEIVQELLPREETVEHTAVNDVLLVNFFVRESGFYEINVLYQGQPLAG